MCCPSLIRRFARVCEFMVCLIFEEMWLVDPNGLGLRIVAPIGTLATAPVSWILARSEPARSIKFFSLSCC
jgi:hypothetical protein